MDASQQNSVASVWKRIFAFFIDSVLISLSFLILVAFFLEKQALEHPDLIAWIMFLMAFGYYSILNSRIGGGQTIGKRLLGIKVVDENSQTISVLRSFFRYFFLSLILSNTSSYLVLYPHNLLIFDVLTGGVFVAATYLFFFNTKTRQTIHDLLVRTYVVNAKVKNVQLGSVWKYHYLVAAVLFLAFCSYSLIESKQRYQEFSEIQTAIKNQTGFDLVKIKIEDRKKTKGRNVLKVEVQVDQQNYKNKQLAQQVSNIVRELYPKSSKYDALDIELKYGYDIGWSSKWHSQIFSFSALRIHSAKAV